MQEVKSKIIYTPDSPLKKPGLLIKLMFRDLFAGQGLAWRLTIRDINAQYRQSILGILWAFILPIANTLTWIFLNRSGIVQLGDTLLPYPVYVFSGTMLWAIFMESLNAPLQKTIAAKSILAKINLPREAIIVSGIYQSIFNGIIKSSILIIALLILGILPNKNILLFPIGFISLILTGTMIGLLLTPLGLLYADIGKVIPLLMQFYMYVTPVVFPMPKSGMSSLIFKLNPVTPIILNSRNWLTGFSSEYLNYFIYVNIFILVLLFLFWIIYRIAMPILIERMSS